MSIEEDGNDEKRPRCVQAAKSLTNQGGNMKCTHLISHERITACSALKIPYVPSLFELGEYCRTTDHRKCPFYLKGIVSMGRLENDKPVLV